MPEESATLRDSDEREALIRARAYELWEREGRPNGRHTEHWAQAEEELEFVDASGSAHVDASPARTS